MESKIRVHAVAQNRTALGIANAYLKLFPKATLEDLNKAFPISLNTSGRSDAIFVNVKDAGKFKSEDGKPLFETYFLEKEDEILKLANGDKVAILETWVKEDFDKIVEHAKQYGIEVASFEEAKPFEKGSFWLEYINGYNLVGDKVEKAPAAKGCKGKCKCWRWLWWLLLLALIALLLFLLLRGCNKCGKKTSPYELKLEQMSKDASTSLGLLKTDSLVKAYPVQFKTGAADIDSVAYPALDSLAFFVKNNPDARLYLIERNAENKADPSADLKLSKLRAKSILSYLLGQGIDPSRVFADGRGNAGLTDSIPYSLEVRLAQIKAAYEQQVADSAAKLAKGEDVTNYPISFEQGSSTLDMSSYAALDQIAKYLNDNPKVKLNIVGYTSPEGSAEVNLKLSKDRAQAVADYLVNEKGIDAQRLVVEGKGSKGAEKLANPEDNRRTEIKVIK